MKKEDKEYVEEIINELVYTRKKPSEEQRRRLIIALEKVKNSPSNNSLARRLLEALLKLFATDR